MFCLWGQWIWENACKELWEAYYPVIEGNKPTDYLSLGDGQFRVKIHNVARRVPLLKTLWVCKKAEKTLRDTS